VAAARPACVFMVRTRVRQASWREDTYATPRPQPAPSKPDNTVRASAVPPESVSATAPKMRVVFVR
jgi:hypothetical protein